MVPFLRNYCIVPWYSGNPGYFFPRFRGRCRTKKAIFSARIIFWTYLENWDSRLFGTMTAQSSYLHNFSLSCNAYSLEQQTMDWFNINMFLSFLLNVCIAYFDWEQVLLAYFIVNHHRKRAAEWLWGIEWRKNINSILDTILSSVPLWDKISVPDTINANYAHN